MILLAIPFTWVTTRFLNSNYDSFVLYVQQFPFRRPPAIDRRLTSAVGGEVVTLEFSTVFHPPIPFPILLIGERRSCGIFFITVVTYLVAECEVSSTIARVL